MHLYSSENSDSMKKQEQKRVDVVELETRISFLYARCRTTKPRYAVDPSVGLNYTPATRVGTVVCPATAADTALGSLLI